MAIVTWASKSLLPWRTMHVRQCDHCGREFLQVAEDWRCPVCDRKQELGITWPIGVLFPPTVANQHGAPCLDLELWSELKKDGITLITLEEFRTKQRERLEGHSRSAPEA